MISFASHLRSLTEGNPERRFWSVRKMKVPGRAQEICGLCTWKQRWVSGHVSLVDPAFSALPINEA